MGKVWTSRSSSRVRAGADTTSRSSTVHIGHGLAMLRAPGTYASIALRRPIGPSGRIDSFIRDPPRPAS